MTHAILSRDVVVMFNGGGNPADGYEVHAPKGTRLEAVKGGQGISYAIPPSACSTPGLPAMEAVSKRGRSRLVSIFAHDSTYHYIWAPRDAVEIVAE